MGLSRLQWYQVIFNSQLLQGSSRKVIIPTFVAAIIFVFSMFNPSLLCYTYFICNTPTKTERKSHGILQTHYL